MKTCGIIGGIGPESTVDYYRSIVDRFRELQPDGRYPSIVINSVDLSKMVGFFNAGDLEGAAAYLIVEVGRLARAGADFGALSANTPHIVFDRVAAASPIPLLSIVEAAREAIRKSGAVRVALLGTRFTMQARFYPDVFDGSGVTLVVPEEAQQELIHAAYMNELLKGIFLPETREQILRIVETLRQRDSIDGVILAGTELPLLLEEQAYDGIRFFDTTAIHVERIVAELLS
jgi:aspartate racemase